MENSLCEKPERHASRRLSDHLVLEGRKQKVHSLVDKVYSRKNLRLAWERVRANQASTSIVTPNFNTSTRKPWRFWPRRSRSFRWTPKRRSWWAISRTMDGIGGPKTRPKSSMF